MTRSEGLIASVKDNLFDPGVPFDLRNDVLDLIEEYRESLRCNLRMESTIHNLMKL